MYGLDKVSCMYFVNNCDGTHHSFLRIRVVNLFRIVPYSLFYLGWKNGVQMPLEAALLSRTKHEIVSYYFNVFVLRRRATQNRSLILDIDSDDVEWHEG